MNLIKIKEKPILVVADIHGSFDYFEKDINKKDLKDCIIIVAGDCGFGFHRKVYYERIFTSMNRHFIERNIHCYMIRGNHDDPYYFNSDIIKFSNVQTIPDYTILSIGKHNILCVGGAISVDRTFRIDEYWKKIDHYAITMNVTLEDAKSVILPYYWEDEMPIYDLDKLSEITNSGIKIDMVVTHTSPSFAFNTDKKEIKFWLKKDEFLSTDLDKERKVLTDLYLYLITNNHPLKKWVYGHFHKHNNEMYNYIEFTALRNCDFDFDIKELNAYDF